MTKYRCLAILVALGFLTVCAAPGAEAAEQAKIECPKVGESCRKDNTTTCYYKFTVKNDDKKGSLDVTYPVSVFSVIKEDEKDEKDKEKEEKAKKGEGDTYSISVKQGKKVEIGKTYAFTRCPDSLYAIGKELKPEDPTKDE